MKTIKSVKKSELSDHNVTEFGLSTTTSHRKMKFGKTNCCFVIAARPREVINQQIKNYLDWKNKNTQIKPNKL